MGFIRKDNIKEEIQCGGKEQQLGMVAHTCEIPALEGAEANLGCTERSCLKKQERREGKPDEVIQNASISSTKTCLAWKIETVILKY